MKIENGGRGLSIFKSASSKIAALAAVLYFSQGFPYGVFVETLNLYLSVAGVPLSTIGLLSGFGIVWTLKVFWAPLVDAIGNYRSWIFAGLAGLTASFAMLSFAAPAGNVFWIAVTLLVIASATQDIAIDALTIRITPRTLLGIVNSARVTAYRVAIIAAGGGIAVVADRTGWPAAFAVTAAVPLIVMAILAIAVPSATGSGERHQNPIRALIEWVTRPRALLLLAVVVLYRLGDSALRPMIKPYWIARGFSATEVASVTTTLGMLCTIAGAIAGGMFVTRFGVYRGLLVLGAVQMLSNLGYAAAAAFTAGRPGMYAAAVTETFCDGLGTGAFLSFLMFICDRENAATEYAMLSAVFALSRTLAGTVSGFIAEGTGFTAYFAITAALALPGLAVIPTIRGILTREEKGTV